MKPIEIDEQNATALDLIPDSCGDVAVGCTDVAGIIEAVMESSARLREEQRALQGTVAELEGNQTKVAAASDEARQLSEKAIGQLGEGTLLIQSSLGEINGLLELVQALATHVTGFAGAMEQVRRSSQDIAEIADTTNILALNATIEAMRAGEAGKTFAVVANEVKGLANDTQRATRQIAQTIDTLGSEANLVIEEIEKGAVASDKARSSVAQIERTIEGVGNLVLEVDKQNEEIARSTGTISNHVGRVQNLLGNFDEAAEANEAKLQDVHAKMNSLELIAGDMYDRIVQAGLSPADTMMVERAKEWKREIEALTEQAIERGQVTMDQLFDTDYKEISGTNPQLYTTSLCKWAESAWQPLFDRANASDPGVMATICTDMNGFLPAHSTEYSQPPNGDIVHDTQYSRSGRIILDTIDKKAKDSDAPYMMAAYRHEADGLKYNILRMSYLPLIFKGRRWGNFEVAYFLGE